MLFSALVDADHLDTERHRNPESAAKRGEADGLGPLLDKLLAGQETLSGKKTDQLGVIRHAVYQRCLSLASEPAGFFRLSAPTGAGKTRSAMAFALSHALGHELQRVISVSPYLTITDQTADVYREIFGEGVILEHHSDANRNDDPDGAQAEEAEWRRLTSQTWDAPIIVTTAVQFFESLFSNKPNACRKLHRIAGSVIVLDEPQTFPSNLLEPIASALQLLVAHFGATVLFCTATQPAMERVPAFANLPLATELAPDPPALFRTLKRVEYVWPDPGATASWEEIAGSLRENHQGMAILNTRKDAMALLDALADADALHLSTYLCGAHRRDVLEHVRKRLSSKEACLLVSTQVVEAGVDLDFPVVLRAMGPLDRIVQAAGRCNREGRMDSGSVIVFRPGEGRLPAGPYRTATDTTEMLLRSGMIDPDDPATFARYFQLLYQAIDLDGKKVQTVRREFQFEEVSRRFHLIEDAGESVIVEYDAPDKNQHGQVRQHKDIVQGLVAELMNAITYGKGGLPREIMQKLQPYIVSVRPYALTRLARDGICKNLTDGLWLWTAGYDERRGIGGAIEAKYEPADLIA